MAFHFLQIDFVSEDHRLRDCNYLFDPTIHDRLKARISFSATFSSSSNPNGEKDHFYWCSQAWSTYRDPALFPWICFTRCCSALLLLPPIFPFAILISLPSSDRHFYQPRLNNILKRFDFLIRSLFYQRTRDNSHGI